MDEKEKAAVAEKMMKELYASREGFQKLDFADARTHLSSAISHANRIRDQLTFELEIKTNPQEYEAWLKQDRLRRVVK